MADAIHVLYPISGNPPSWGHGDVMERAARVFPRITWAVAINPNKTYMFSPEERMEMMNSSEEDPNQEYLNQYVAGRESLYRVVEDADMESGDLWG